MLTPINCSESSLNILLMLNVIYLRHTVLIYYSVHQCGLTALKQLLKKLKVAYNNSSRRFMILPWRNSASEMFANLSIPSFDELLRILVFGFRSRIIVSNKLFISSIYNSTCRIYSYKWTWLDNLLFMFPP